MKNAPATVVKPSLPQAPGAVEWPFIGGATLEQRLEIRKPQRCELAQTLGGHPYFFQYPGGRKIFWNWVLVRDYLLRGTTTDLEHQALVQAYLASLPRV